MHFAVFSMFPCKERQMSMVLWQDRPALVPINEEQNWFYNMKVTAVVSSRPCTESFHPTLTHLQQKRLVIFSARVRACIHTHTHTQILQRNKFESSRKEINGGKITNHVFQNKNCFPRLKMIRLQTETLKENQFFM